MMSRKNVLRKKIIKVNKDLCNVCKAGTLIGDESLVQSVSQPCAHHLDLESYQVEKVLKLKRNLSSEPGHSTTSPSR